MKHVYISLLLVCGINAFAVTLPNLPESPRGVQPVVTAPVPCDQIVDQLLAYNSRSRESSDAWSTYLGQVSERITGWYDLLSPLEGGTKAIEVDTFKPLQDGAIEIEDLTNISYDTAEILYNDLNSIITSLQACQASLPR